MTARASQTEAATPLPRKSLYDGLVQLVDRHDIWPSRVNPQLGEDGHEHLAEGFEAFWAIPDVVDHEVAILAEAGVVEAMRVGLPTGFLQALVDLVELFEGHVPGMEVRRNSHGSSLVVLGPVSLASSRLLVSASV